MLRIRVPHDDSSSGLVPATIRPFQQPVDCVNVDPADLTSTPIEKALDELRVRFPTSIVIGFEELYDPRPDREPEIDLGPKDLSLKDVLNRVRSIDPRYRVELWQGSLIHVYPASETADPVGMLDIRLRQFVMPQDSCLGQAIEYVDEWFHGYAPELIQFLAKRKDAWYREHGREVPGMAGDILGNCISLAAPGPMYRNITVRDALNFPGALSGESRRSDPKRFDLPSVQATLGSSASDENRMPTVVLEGCLFSRLSSSTSSSGHSPTRISFGVVMRTTSTWRELAQHHSPAAPALGLLCKPQAK